MVSLIDWILAQTESDDSDQINLHISTICALWQCQICKREINLIDLNGNDGFELKYKWKWWIWIN